VVQLTVAEFGVMPMTLTPEMTGAAAAVVLKVKFGDVAEPLAPVTETTS
jgi:hypothetical protein